MKRFIAAFFVIICFSSYSQLTKNDLPSTVEVGKVNKAGALLAKTYYYIKDGDTTYTLFYRDQRYSALVSFEGVVFSETGGTFNALYEECRKAIEADKGYKSSLTLGDDDVTISTDRFLGTKCIFLFVNNKGYLKLNRNEINKLFAKY